jgi:transposase-like protein
MPGLRTGGDPKNGRDRQGRQVYQCRHCRRRFTALSVTPFSGYCFSPDVIALAVRWYLRFGTVRVTGSPQEGLGVRYSGA